MEKTKSPRPGDSVNKDPIELGFNVPPPLSYAMQQVERHVTAVTTRPSETLRVTIKHLSLGAMGCVFVARIDDASPLKNHRVVELGSQLTHINGEIITSSGQVSEVIQRVSLSDEIDKKIVWSFHNKKLEDTRERIKRGGVEENEALITFLYTNTGGKDHYIEYLRRRQAEIAHETSA